METAVEIRGIRKTFRSGTLGRYRVEALHRLDLTIRPNEVFGLLGPNGSGKSTTIKILLDLVRPDEGECMVFGRRARLPGARRRVGYVPEAPFFYNHLTGSEVVRSMARLSGVPAGEAPATSARVLALVGLKASADRPIRTYSKGMLQRLGLAQAIVHDPDLVILDEPTAGVDPIGAREIADLIRLLKESGKTVLLCSHLLSQVETVCDRIAILHRGHKLLEGPLDELTARRETAAALEFPSEDGAGQASALLRREGIEHRLIEPPRETLEALFIRAVGSFGKEDPRP